MLEDGREEQAWRCKCCMSITHMRQNERKKEGSSRENNVRKWRQTGVAKMGKKQSQRFMTWVTNQGSSPQTKQKIIKKSRFYETTWGEYHVIETKGASLQLSDSISAWPMQETQTQSLVWEGPTCHRTTRPMHPGHWAVLWSLAAVTMESHGPLKPCSATRRTTAMREACSAQPENSPAAVKTGTAK